MPEGKREEKNEENEAAVRGTLRCEKSSLSVGSCGSTLVVPVSWKIVDVSPWLDERPCHDDARERKIVNCIANETRRVPLSTEISVAARCSSRSISNASSRKSRGRYDSPGTLHARFEA